MPRNERMKESSWLDCEPNSVSIGEELFGVKSNLVDSADMPEEEKKNSFVEKRDELIKKNPEQAIVTGMNFKENSENKENIIIKKELKYAQKDGNSPQISEITQPIMRQIPQQTPRIPEYVYPKLSEPHGERLDHRSLLIDVYSPKGGVGKSSITKELATAYATFPIGKRHLNVLIMDADWEYGDITTLFGVRPKPSMAEWAQDMISDKNQLGYIPIYPKQEIRKKYIIPFTNNIHILAAPADPIDSELITEEIVSAVLMSLRRCSYDVIIIDSANSNRARTLVPIMAADAVVLIETLDTTTVAETAAVLKTLKAMQCDMRKIHMVLNEVPVERSKLDIYVEDVAKLLQLEIAAVIPKWEMLRIINNAGEAAVTMKPSPYSKAIMKLANNLMPAFPSNSQKGIMGFISYFRKK